MKKDSMLAKLIGSFSPEAAEAVASDATMAVQVEFDAFKTATEANTTELSTALTAAMSAVAEADTKVAELTAQLAALTAQMSEFKAQAVAAKLTARKEKLVAAVGTARADALMDSTQGVDDVAFETVVSALTLSSSLESKTKLFVEQGADAQADASKTVAVESETMKIVKQRVAAGLHTTA